MVQKPTSISVIVPVVVAGILILAALAAISSTNQALAQAKPTTLGIASFPCCERKTVGSEVRQGFNVQLTSEGSGVGGATIHLIGVPGSQPCTTDSSGRCIVVVTLGLGTYDIHAHYAGDNEHESSDSSTKTFTVTR